MLHLEKLNQLDNHVAYVQQKLQRKDVFLVGWCVRDILLGIDKTIVDLDVTLAWQPKAIADSIDKSAISFFMTEKYGTMTIIPKNDQPADNSKETLQYEITPFRTESAYTDSRHPDQVNWTDNLVLDSQRRDFTINAMYYTTIHSEKLTSQPSKSDEQEIDPQAISKSLEKTGLSILWSLNVVFISDSALIERFFPAGKFDETTYIAYIHKHFKKIDSDRFTSEWWRFVLDPSQGLLDMLHRKLKAVGEADKRIEEDALRLMRALRFVNVLNHKLQKKSEETCFPSAYFDFEKTTWKAVKKNYYKIQHVAKERIKTELDKVFQSGNPAWFIGLLDETNMLKYLFPALYATKWVNQPVRYHPFDVYVHSLLCLKEFQEINGDYIARYAMIYHDVGKTEQYYSYEMGLNQEEVREVFGTWLNHIRCGADMVAADFKALWFSKKEVDALTWYVANHMKIGEIAMAKKANWKKKIRKLISEAGPERVLNLIDITVADRLGQQNPVQPPAIEELIELEEMVNEIMEEEGQFTIKAMDLNGNDLMEAFSLPAWPKLGAMITQAFNWVIDDIQARNKKDIILQRLQDQES